MFSAETLYILSICVQVCQSLLMPSVDFMEKESADFQVLSRQEYPNFLIYSMHVYILSLSVSV